MRCFVAVDLDHSLREKVVKLQTELAGLDTKLVEPENLHFTLKFLGEVDEGMVKQMKVVIEDIASRCEPFSIKVNGTGVFPNEKFISVVWLGAPELYNLQAATEQALAGLFKKEKPEPNDAERQPIPHLTLARVRSQHHLKEINDFIRHHKDIEIGEMKVDRIKLKKSTVTSKGPVYEDIAVFKLH